MLLLPRVEFDMTRAQAIAIIEKVLPTADEATLSAVIELLHDASAGISVLPRELTARELALIEQSREDFKAGRVYSTAEVRAYLDEVLAPLGVPKSKP